MDKPLVINAANPEQVKSADQKTKRTRERETEDLYFLLSTSQGRDYFWSLLEFCGVYRDSMTGSSMTFYNEGRRSVGLKLLADITKASPEAFIQMMKNSEKEK